MRGVTPERVSKGGVSDAESEKGVTPGHRVIVRGVTVAVSKNGVSLLIDAMSYQYLVGAEIDYKDDLQGAQFVIKNPNATTTCGCGSSFSA